MEAMSGLHVSPDHTSGKTRVRWAIDSVPLCWGKSLQCWLTGEFCCSLTLQSWLVIETLRPVDRHGDLPKFPALVSVPGSSAGDFLLGTVSILSLPAEGSAIQQPVPLLYPYISTTGIVSLSSWSNKIHFGPNN